MSADGVERVLLAENVEKLQACLHRRTWQLALRQNAIVTHRSLHDCVTLDVIKPNTNSRTHVSQRRLKNARIDIFGVSLVF